MTVLRGFEDLRPRRVIALPVVVAAGDEKAFEMDLFVSPTGSVFARPVEPPPVDQIGERKPTSVERRHQGVDQL